MYSYKLIWKKIWKYFWKNLTICWWTISMSRNIPQRISLVYLNAFIKTKTLRYIDFGRELAIRLSWSIDRWWSTSPRTQQETTACMNVDEPTPECITGLRVRQHIVDTFAHLCVYTSIVLRTSAIHLLAHPHSLRNIQCPTPHSTRGGEWLWLQKPYAGNELFSAERHKFPFLFYATHSQKENQCFSQKIFLGVNHS